MTDSVERTILIREFVQLRFRGAIFHTYSTYARGLDNLNPVYQLLDLTPHGRDESDLPYPQDWVRRHDEY